MKKKTTSSKNLNAKLKNYSALAVSAIALDVSAQVGYTDIPDATLINDGDFIDIDLNNDGINEIRITKRLVNVQTTYTYSTYSGSTVTSFFSATGSAVSARASNGSLNLSSSYSSGGYPIAFSLNQPINSSVNRWQSSTGTSSPSYNAFLAGSINISYGTGSATSSIIGNFNNQTDKYLGVRFPAVGSGNFHYGWVRLDVTGNGTSAIIKDFAYDSTANAPILAGDNGTLVGLAEKNLAKVDFYSSHGQINFRGVVEGNTQLTILNLKGQEVQKALLSQNETQLSLKDFNNGIYIVELRNGESITRKKLWLESE